MQSSTMHSPKDESRQSADAGEALPRVWVIMGYRAGERTQTLALAEALGLPFELKRPRHSRYDFVPGLLRRESLLGVRRCDRAELAPPWPDLVISAGMRNEPICRWIKQQSRGSTRLVHIGRPWARIEHFDLVITTPQYRLPRRPNVLQNLGTLHSVTPATLAEAGAVWRPRFADLPRPHMAVIVGGNSGPYTFGPRTAARLGRRIGEITRLQGGSALVTTSSRTTAKATASLRETLRCPHYFYEWSPTADENPYLGILADADEIVVTSDSVSMLSEATATQKPVYMFDLGMDHTPATARGEADLRLGAWLYRLLMRFAHPRLSRDLGLFHQALIDSGRASWLEQRAAPASNQPSTDRDRAVVAVMELLGQRLAQCAEESG
ncbi:MAG: mitochondrial fission ELM1 family protein [Chromatiales bacterium]|jgi:hypothetical protein